MNEEPVLVTHLDDVACARGATARTYRDAAELMDAEAERDDGADVVAIMTPNDSHHAYIVGALDRGFDVHL